jgi:hypothetical protein
MSSILVLLLLVLVLPFLFLLVLFKPCIGNVIRGGIFILSQEEGLGIWMIPLGEIVLTSCT